MGTMSRRTMLGLGGGAMAAGLGGCSLLGYGTWNFLWTVTVNTKDGPKSGSAVYQVHLAPPVGTAPFGLQWAGISPVIDLGDRGWLIALLSVDEGYMPNAAPVRKMVGSALVDSTYLRDTVGWGGGNECPVDKALACANSALDSAGKVTAPDNLRPAFAYAPRSSETLADVKAYWDYELPQYVGPDVSYAKSTIEPTQFGPSRRLALNGSWYERVLADPKTGYATPVQASHPRYVSLQYFE